MEKNKELERLIEKMVNEFTILAVALTETSPDKGKVIDDTTSFSISQKTINALDGEGKVIFYTTMFYFVDSLEYTVDYLEKHMPEVHKLYKGYKLIVDDIKNR